jgi:branched-chain amino acid aminotransferase
MELRLSPLPEHERKQMPVLDETLSFGRVFTDHWFAMEYSDGVWQEGRIEPLRSMSLHPAARGLHYGQLIFEGMKAYHEAGDYFLFRPEENFKRLNASARRLVMPEVDEAFVLSSLEKLLYLDKNWIPTKEGFALYIRPTMIATEENLSAGPANKYLFYILLSPVGAYYSSGLKPVNIYITDAYSRASLGGCGSAKAAGNYAAGLIAQKEGLKYGCHQVLWLDSAEKKYIEEVGAMNIFIRFKDTLVTPPLEGTILPGITRDSVLKITRDWGLKVEERKVALTELLEGIESGDVVEVFGTGTAAVVSPVGRVRFKDKEYAIAQEQTGELTQKIHDHMLALYRGKVNDPHGFSYPLNLKQEQLII